MKRYYFVSYMYKDIDGLEVNIGNIIFTVAFYGLHIRRCEKYLENKYRIKNVAILNFQELTEEEYKINLNKEEDK